MEKFTDFPVYTFSFKKDLLEDSEIEKLKIPLFPSITLVNSWNSDNDSLRFMPLRTVERKKTITLSFSLKEFPPVFYKDFVFVSTILMNIYDLPVNLKSFEEIKETSEYSTKYIRCTGVLNTDMLNKTFSMNTDDEFFNTGQSVKDWVYTKTGIVIPSNKPVRVKIKYNIDPENPYVMFRKNDEEELIETIQKIETRSIDGLKLAHWGNFVPSPSRYIPPEEVVNKLKNDKEIIEKVEEYIYGIEISEFIENTFLGNLSFLLNEREYVAKLIRKLVEQNEPSFTELISKLLQRYLHRYFDMITSYLNREALGEDYYSIDEKYDENEIESVKDFIKDLISITELEELKAILMRLLSMLEIDESRQIEILQEALNFRADKVERTLIYYQLIQHLIFSGDIRLAEDYLEKAISEFEDEDAFYEMYGHIGIMYLSELGDRELAKKYLEYVYQWLQFRTLDKELEADFMNTNFIFFLGELAKLYREEKDFEKAKKIYPFALQLFIKYYDVLKYEPFDITSASVEYLLKEYTDFISEVENKPPEKVFRKVKRRFTKHEEIIRLHDSPFITWLKDLKYKDLYCTESEC